jgi:hypothetical protein
MVLLCELESNSLLAEDGPAETISGLLRTVWSESSYIE